MRFVPHLPDLITDADYLEPDRKRIRVRLAITPDGIEILADSMYAPLLEKLLADVGAKEIERMLCG
jgi:hypothetical protein